MKKVGLQTWHLTYPHFWSKYIHPLISCWSILHLVRRLCSISPSVAIGPAMRGAALGGVFEVGLSLNLETQLKKRNEKNGSKDDLQKDLFMFLWWVQKNYDQLDVSKNRDLPFDLGRLLNSETCGFGGNVIKPYVKPLFPGFRLFYLYSLFILPLLVRSEGNWDFHCRYWRSAQGGTAARSAKTQAGKRSGWWLHGRKGLLPRRCLSRPGLKHIDNIDVRLQLLPGSLTLFLFFFSFFLYFFLLFSFFLSFVFLCFSLFQLCSSYVFIFFLFFLSFLSSSFVSFLSSNFVCLLFLS